MQNQKQLFCSLAISQFKISMVVALLTSVNSSVLALTLSRVRTGSATFANQMGQVHNLRSLKPLSCFLVLFARRHCVTAGQPIISKYKL